MSIWLGIRAFQLQGWRSGEAVGVERTLQEFKLFQWLSWRTKRQSRIDGTERDCYVLCFYTTLFERY
jgi:uncharacterized membrane protein